MDGDVELTDLTLRGLINDPRLRKEYPSIYRAFERGSAPAGCGRCGRRAAKDFTTGLTAARKAIIGLGQSGRNRVKEVVGAQRLVLKIPTGQGGRRAKVVI